MIGLKLLAVGILGGLVMMIPYALLGVGASISSALGGGTGLVAGLGALGIGLLGVSLFVNGYIANRLWKWA